MSLKSIFTILSHYLSIHRGSIPRSVLRTAQLGLSQLLREKMNSALPSSMIQQYIQQLQQCYIELTRTLPQKENITPVFKSLCFWLNFRKMYWLYFHQSMLIVYLKSQFSIIYNSWIITTVYDIKNTSWKFIESIEWNEIEIFIL